MRALSMTAVHGERTQLWVISPCALAARCRAEAAPQMHRVISSHTWITQYTRERRAAVAVAEGGRGGVCLVLEIFRAANND